jgi:hypothetical protein
VENNYRFIIYVNKTDLNLNRSDQFRKQAHLCFNCRTKRTVSDLFVVLTRIFNLTVIVPGRIISLVGRKYVANVARKVFLSTDK